MAPNNTLAIWGNEKTMNLNSLILTNIQSSPYFKVNLYEKKTYHEVIDEIFYKVSHLEPWEKGSRKTAGQTGMCGGVRGVGAGGIVSSAYCLLYKLFTLRLTRKQLVGLLDHADSPYIRGLGFMYIRYTQDPKDMWDWYEPYLDDDEEIDVKAGGGHVITIGEMLRQWLVKLEWYSTLFPRIPVPVQKDIDVKMRERNMQMFEVQQEEAPRHIADDELNFGEAERYATTAATRARSPTPPYRSRPRTPPLRHRSPRHSPPRHRSPRTSPSRHRMHRHSPNRHRHKPPRPSRSPHGHRSPRPRDGEPMDFTKELLREKERQGKQHPDDRSRSVDEDDDDDPINFAKKLLREKEKQQQGMATTFREKLEQRAKSIEVQKMNENEKHHKRARSKEKNNSVTVSKEKHRKRSHSKDKEDKSSHEKSKHHRSHEKKSKKHHRSRSREREKKKHKSKHRSRSLDRNGHQP